MTTRSIQCVAIVQAITSEVSWSVVPESGGSVQRSGTGPDSICTASSCQVVLGETIRLEAVSSAGYHFSGWSACSATADPVLELTPVDAPQHCQANFEPDL